MKQYQQICDPRLYLTLNAGNCFMSSLIILARFTLRGLVIVVQVGV